MSVQNDNRHKSSPWATAGIAILVYVLSAVQIEWLAQKGFLSDLDSSVLAAIRVFYLPLKWLLNWFSGLGGP